MEFKKCMTFILKTQAKPDCRHGDTHTGEKGRGFRCCSVTAAEDLHAALLKLNTAFVKLQGVIRKMIYSSIFYVPTEEFVMGYVAL